MFALMPSLTTPDLPRCLAFYRDALGFKCTGEMGQEGRVTWAELRRGAAKLMLLAAEEQPEEAGTRYDAVGVIFYLEVDRLGALRNDLISRGLTVSPME